MISLASAINEERRMLEGNLNRMNLTNDRIELEKMFLVAKARLDRIHYYQCVRLKNDEE